MGWKSFPADLRNGQKKSYKAARYSKDENWGATRDPEEIKRNFARWPSAGIGLPTGPDNRLLIIEGDTIAGHGVDGFSGLAALEAEHGPWPDTLMAESPSGSLHRYFLHPCDGRKIVC